MYSLLYANAQEKVYDAPGFFALGRSGNLLVEIQEEDMIPMPAGASLVVLPGRAAAGIDRHGNIVPFSKSGASAVAALLPQGYLRILLPAYKRVSEVLPLFGYTAVGWRNGQLYVAAKPVADGEMLRRWQPSLFNTAELPSLVKERQNEFPANRIMQQLAYCALEYGCFTAQNIIYRRFEAGLPISPICNANCVGCISLQAAGCCPSPQSRINFIPTVNEAVEVAVAHLSGGGDMISFGQGCEGEPLVQGQLAADIVVGIRAQTTLGKINANTNGGNFQGVKAVVDAGIDSLRVSLNSVRQELYNSYYRQNGYALDDVVKSIIYARTAGVFVSLNLLVLPGVSDREEEISALLEFIENTDVNQVQFRNLNIDPDLYLSLLPAAKGEVVGMQELVAQVQHSGVSVR